MLLNIDINFREADTLTSSLFTIPFYFPKIPNARTE